MGGPHAEIAMELDETNASYSSMYLSMSSMVSWGKAGAKFGILNSGCWKLLLPEERLKSSEYSAAAAIGTFFRADQIDRTNGVTKEIHREGPASCFTGPVAIWNTCGGIPSVSEVHLGPEARDPVQFMRKSRTVAVQALIGNRKLAPLINSHLTMDSSIILSTQGADWKSETGPLNLDHIAKILDIVVLNTVSDQQTILRGVVADVDCFKFQSQFCKAQDFLALLDALCNWSYITQLFSKSEQSSHLRRMIVDIVITELLRCMILISCVSEGKEPFVRSKNFNVYIMDEAVSITFSVRVLSLVCFICIDQSMNLKIVDRGYDLKVHLYQLVLKLILLARACLRPIASSRLPQVDMMLIMLCKDRSRTRKVYDSDMFNLSPWLGFRCLQAWN
ncbi:hypothetical protein LINPERHAP2_LOCUS23570 [Linum perenne]